MKQIIILGIAGLVACTPQKTKRVSILEDVTENGQREISLLEVPGVSFDESIWEGRVVRYSMISDLSICPITEIILDPAHQMASNEPDRKDEVNAFLKRVSEIKQGDSLEYNHSCIWTHLTKELTYLSKDSTLPTKVYLISDLMEYGTWISLYDESVQAQLERNPESIRDHFIEKLPEIERMSHIDLVIIHEPSYEDGALFESIVKDIYRPILEDSLGIGITIKARL